MIKRNTTKNQKQMIWIQLELLLFFVDNLKTKEKQEIKQNKVLTNKKKKTLQNNVWISRNA